MAPTLLLAITPLATTTTDIDGYYGFGGGILEYGNNYTLRVVTTTLTTTLASGVTLTPTFDYDGGIGNPDSETL